MEITIKSVMFKEVFNFSKKKILAKLIKLKIERSYIFFPKKIGKSAPTQKVQKKS